MTPKKTSDQEERIICFCHHVTEEALIRAIRGGAKTHGEIQAQTLASTGCGGCESSVLEILNLELSPKI